MDNRISTSSDLAKNWNGSIAVKVTAMTLWSIMLLAFIITIPFLTSFEKSVLKEYTWQTSLIHNAILQAGNEGESVSTLQKSLENILNDANIRNISLNFGRDFLNIGTPEKNNYIQEELIDILKNDEHIMLHVEYPPLDYAVNIVRAEIGSAVVSIAVLFGLFMFWVNRNIVHAPFTSIVSLTQKIAGGETSLRLDTSRGDEFGELAKFMNRMLDTLESNQSALRKVNKELLSEIINREEALAASQQKSTFLANMSHEIRTPLSSIIGYTERLKENNARGEKEKQEMLDIVLQNGTHLLHLINDILDLSKVEANKLEVEPSRFSIFDSVNHIRDLLHDKAMENGNRLQVQYVYPIPEFVYADPVRTKQIILNLCTNAVRFTSDGIVTISVGFERENDFLVIGIKDTGMGMTQEELYRLFKPFTQADASIAKNYGGTGLGLAISKRLAELMGGDITAQSVKGLGSKFICRIKAGYNRSDKLINNASEITKVDFVEVNQSNAEIIKGKILLVEDTQEIQRLVKSYLEDYGIEIDTANDGQQGVQMAMINNYDLVLMDIQMPVMNGKDATRLLRKKGYAKPIIALTADAISQHASEFLALGFTETLTKPIEVRRLISRVQYYITNQPQHAVAAMSDKAGDEDIVNDVRNKFMLQLSGQIQEIEAAIRRGDIVVAHFILHQIKGIGGSVDLLQFTSQSAEIADALHQNRIGYALDKLFEMKIVADNLLTWPT